MKSFITAIAIILTVGLTSSTTFAQFGEPEVKEKDQPRNLFDEGFRTGFGINASLNDFGFSAGGQFRFVFDSYTEALLTFKIAGLKDPTEQTFVDYYWGSRTVPEKYRRILSTPVYVGIKKRFFADAITDNFRVYSSLSAGPVFALSYSYFQDLNGNGFRENDSRVYNFVEPINDVFAGFNNSKTHWGMGGEFVIGIDFGENFSSLSSVQFGYTMNYFSKGIQVLEPCQPDLNRINEQPINPCGMGQNFVSVGQNAVAPLEKANSPRKYFGSAEISFIFGWMW